MNPAIPLSPQQKRIRRNNIIFITAGACAALAALGYLFFPEEGLGQLIPQLTADSTPHQSDPADGADSAENRDAPALISPAAPRHSESSGATQAPEAAPAAPAPAATSAATSAPTTRSQRPAAESPANNSPAADKADSAASSAQESTPAAEEERPAAPTDELGLTEEDIARLPSWQAGFVRLSQSERAAFATAFTKAKAAYNGEQWANCLAHLNNCDLIYDGSPNVWNLRACALLATNELDAAAPFIARSLKLDPTDSVALMCQSELYMLRKEFGNSIPVLEKLRHMHRAEPDRALHDAFTFHQLLCHLMLRQEMEARALVAGLSPLCDSPLYYYSEAAFSVYRGDSNGALEPLRSASNIFGNGGATSSYRKWMNKCGLADKYVRNKRR